MANSCFVAHISYMIAQGALSAVAVYLAAWTNLTSVEAAPIFFQPSQVKFQPKPRLNPHNPMGQVNSVNKLQDISPTDWTYEALRSLVERYSCLEVNLCFWTKKPHLCR